MEPAAVCIVSTFFTSRYWSVSNTVCMHTDINKHRPPFPRRLSHRNPDVTLEAILAPVRLIGRAQKTRLRTHPGAAVMPLRALSRAVGIRGWQLEGFPPSFCGGQGVADTAEEVAERMGRIGDGATLHKTPVGEGLQIGGLRGVHGAAVSGDMVWSGECMI